MKLNNAYSKHELLWYLDNQLDLVRDGFVFVSVIHYIVELSHGSQTGKNLPANAGDWV